MIKRGQKGFTIIELLLATSFFTAVMLMVVAGYVQINRSYTRGLTVKEVQNSARSIINEISDGIRNSDGSNIGFVAPHNHHLQIGGTCYIWNQEDLDTPETLTSETFTDNTNLITIAKSTATGACTTGIAQDDPLTETLLDEKLMIQSLRVNPIGTSNSYVISVVVSTNARGEFGEDFASLGDDAACTVRRGDEFCDIAKLSTVVTARN